MWKHYWPWDGLSMNKGHEYKQMALSISLKVWQYSELNPTDLGSLILWWITQLKQHKIVAKRPLTTYPLIMLVPGSEAVPQWPLKGFPLLSWLSAAAGYWHGRWRTATNSQQTSISCSLSLDLSSSLSQGLSCILSPQQDTGQPKHSGTNGTL